ncbi:MAG: LysE family translocator [Bacteroidota bacterium]
MSPDALHYLLAGTLLGLTAGIAPGPLLTVLLTQTIKHNRAEGIKVAISPLITDLPIILLTYFVFSKLAAFDTVLGIISFVGAVYIAWLGYESFNTKPLEINPDEKQAGSLKKGILANFLNPHPYLFWATIGMPYIIKAGDDNNMAIVLFFVSFYLLLIGSKVILALLAGHSKAFINDRYYVLIMKFLGVLLLLFAVIFLYDGYTYLSG